MSAAHPSPDATGGTGRSGTPRAQAVPPPVDPLADDELAEEIELYTDVLLAASESDGPLRAGELDRLLGVDGRPGAQ